MEFDEITWQIVPNTVVSRMLDSSMTHKLIPSRKIRQRTKAMNNAIKRSRDLKTYNRYVKMKTSLLRKLTDDEETDHDSSFTDDDYSIMYKSDVSLRNYLTQMSKKNNDYFHDDDIDINEDDIMSDTDSSKLVVETLKTKELGWRRVLKKRGKIASDVNDCQRNGEKSLESQDSEKLLLETPERNSVNLEDNVSVNKKLHIVDKVEGLCVKNANINSKEMASDINSVRKCIRNCNQFIQPHPVVNESSQRLQAADDCGIMSDSIGILMRKKKKKKNQACVLDNINDVNSDKDSSTNQNLSVSQNDSSHLNLHENARVSSAKDKTNGKICKIQPSIISNSNQPKDSGIEEDTEEESQEHREKSYNKIKHKRHRIEESAPINLPNFTSGKNLTGINDTLKCEGCNLLNETNSRTMAEFLNKGGSKDIECPEKIAQKHKLPPKVTHMQNVRRKYKIVMCNECLPVNARSPSLQKFSMQDICNEVIHEREEFGENMEDTVPLLTKKRLSQLRRLNLTIDSDSSLSDNEDTKCAIESMRDKLFKRSTEYSECPNSEYISVRSEYTISMYADNKSHSDKNLEIENCKERKTSSFVKTNWKDIQSEGPLKQTSFCLTNNKNTLKKHPKVKHALLTADNILPQKSNLECDGSRNFDQGEYVKKSDRQCIGNTSVQNTQSIMQNEKQEVTRRCRPCNLQELVEEENLVLDTGSATFTLEDIGEHELFIVDIPSVVFDKQLVGSKMVLTEKKLKLGKEKYKAEYKSVCNVSCVFASEKSRRPYKTVNVKPFASIVAHQRL